MDLRSSPQAAGNSHVDAVAYLHEVYDKHGTGFGRDRLYEDCNSTLDPNNLQYGEVTLDGMEPLHDALRLKHDDVLYDLGSGTGKLVLYTALRAQVARSVGLEIGERRHELASNACLRLSNKLEHPVSKLPVLSQTCSDFVVEQADICRYNHSDVTVVVFTNVCMDMLVQSRALDQLLKCSKFRRIASVSPMMPHVRLKLVDTVMAACSWAVSSWHIYDVLPRKANLLRNDFYSRPPALLPRSRSAAKSITPVTSKSVLAQLPRRTPAADSKKSEVAKDTLGLHVERVGSKPPEARLRNAVKGRGKSLPPSAGEGNSLVAVRLPLVLSNSVVQ